MACVCFLKRISRVANYITTLDTLAGGQGNRSRVIVATHPLMCPSSMTLLSDPVLFKSLNLKRVVLSSSGGSGRSTQDVMRIVDGWVHAVTSLCVVVWSHAPGASTQHRRGRDIWPWSAVSSSPCLSKAASRNYNWRRKKKHVISRCFCYLKIKGLNGDEWKKGGDGGVITAWMYLHGTKEYLVW